MTSPSYPRVLHVGFNPIGSPSNTGLTLGSMFAEWPADRLFELYTTSGQMPTTGPSVMVAPASSAPVDGLVRKVLGSRLPAPVTDGIHGAVSRKGVPTPLRVRARVTVSLLNDLGPVWARGAWVSQVRAWRPEVIHSLLGGVRITRLVLALSRRLQVPIVPHFMDDWMGTLYTDGQLLGLARREVDRLIRAVLARSPLCITIGKDMQEEYASRLGKECRVVGNSVDFDAFAGLQGPVLSDGRVRQLSYVGGLHLGRADAIHEAARSIARHHAAGGVPWTLRLLVPAADVARAEAMAAENPCISVGGTIAPSEVPAALVGSDALLFVESSAAGIAHFTRLSVSTKVPEYLAARRPVLALGPADQASVRALRRSPITAYAGHGHDSVVLDRAWDHVSRWGENGPDAITVDPGLVDDFSAAATRARLHEALRTAAGAP